MMIRFEARLGYQQGGGMYVYTLETESAARTMCENWCKSQAGNNYHKAQIVKVMTAYEDVESFIQE